MQYLATTVSASMASAREAIEIFMVDDRVVSKGDRFGKSKAAMIDGVDESG